MRILVSNDDGINAKGIKTLENIARSISEDVWVVAPHIQKSACAHSITIGGILRLMQLEEKKFAVNGTPADCVIIALNELFKDKKPDLILSGINKGSNIAEDITYSGTISAAIEGTFHKIPSIALSQAYLSGQKINWSVAAHCGQSIIQQVLAVTWFPQALINVNFPAVQKVSDIKGIRVVPHGISRLTNKTIKQYDPDNKAYYWIVSDRERKNTTEKANCDLEVIAQNYISVTPINLDMNHNELIESMSKINWSSDW